MVEIRVTVDCTDLAAFRIHHHNKNKSSSTRSVDAREIGRTMNELCGGKGSTRTAENYNSRSGVLSHREDEDSARLGLRDGKNGEEKIGPASP